jgi:hypothetical protein
MRKMTNAIAVLAVIALALTSCQKESKTSSEEISQAVKDQIYAAGFGTSNIQKVEEGYLVEGDIILTPEWLNSNPARQILRVGTLEQYNTTNLVTGWPRTITVSLSSKLATKPGYAQALQELVDRYNAVANLDLNFAVGPVGNGDIDFVEGHGQYLASAGFPTSNGQPYGTVKVNAQFIGSGTSNTFINYLATIFSHEAGHCIGFRHSDWFDRSISCGGATSNEGQSTVGAIWIPGTPQAPDIDSGSWMLACISNGQNRPFTNYDKTALTYLY